MPGEIRAAVAAANRYTQPMPWDPMRDYAFMKRNTDDFMSLWRSEAIR